MIRYRNANYRIAMGQNGVSHRCRENERVFTHRRLTQQLPIGGPLLFSEDCSDEASRNSHYGRHVWTLNTALPETPDWLVAFAADFYGVDADAAWEELNPADIVDTARAWDDMDFVSAVWDQFEDRAGGFKLYDGAVVLDPTTVALTYRYDDDSFQ